MRVNNEACPCPVAYRDKFEGEATVRVQLHIRSLRVQRDLCHLCAARCFELIGMNVKMSFSYFVTHATYEFCAEKRHCYLCAVRGGCW
jgi:hypothetical protein